jgi:hypothetical protein
MSTTSRNPVILWAICILASVPLLRADQLQMQNGDHYEGKVLSMTEESIVFQSDVLGKVTLPRNKVSQMTFGSAAAPNAAQTTTAAPTPSAPVPASTNADLSAAFRNLGSNTNFIEQIRGQMLAGAGPAANQKYDELLGGLMSGKLDISDIRNEAKKSADQIRQLKRELGPEADSSLDAYLTILDNFVNEATPTTPPPAATVPPPAPANFGTGNTNVPPKPNLNLQTQPTK